MPALSLVPLPALEPISPTLGRQIERPHDQSPRFSYIYSPLLLPAWLVIGGCLLLFCAVGLRFRAWRIRERARARTNAGSSRHGNGKGAAEMDRERESSGLQSSSMSGEVKVDWGRKAELPLPKISRKDGNQRQDEKPLFRQQPATAQEMFEEEFLDGPEYMWQEEPLEEIPELSTSEFSSSSPNEASALDGSNIPRRRSYTKNQDGVEVQGEVVMGDTWRRHTRVYGGGVCLACLESENKMVGMGLKA